MFEMENRSGWRDVLNRQMFKMKRRSKKRDGEINSSRCRNVRDIEMFEMEKRLRWRNVRDNIEMFEI